MAYGLPTACLINNPFTNEVVMLKYGHPQFYPTELGVLPVQLVDEMNRQAGISIVQKEAMEIGYNFGWECEEARVH